MAMNQSVSSQSSSGVSWKSSETSFAAPPKEKICFVMTLAITSIVVGLLGILAVQGVNLGPIRSFSKITIWGSGAFIVAGIALLIINAVRTKNEPSVTYEKPSEVSYRPNTFSFKNALAEALGKHPVLSNWRIYVVFSENEKNVVLPIIQQAISHAKFAIWSDFESSRVTIKIREASLNSADTLKEFLAPLANQLAKNNVSVSVPTNLNPIKTDNKSHKYFYYGLAVGNSQTLPEFPKDITY